MLELSTPSFWCDFRTNPTSPDSETLPMQGSMEEHTQPAQSSHKGALNGFTWGQERFYGSDEV